MFHFVSNRCLSLRLLDIDGFFNETDSFEACLQFATMIRLNQIKHLHFLMWPIIQ